VRSSSFLNIFPHHLPLLLGLRSVGRTRSWADRMYFLLQPLSHPRIPETIFASTAEGREPFPPASDEYTTDHTQRPADIYPGVQLYAYEEGAAARLLGTRARVTQYHRSCDTPVPYP
jgi:hypothetical protein